MLFSWPETNQIYHISSLDVELSELFSICQAGIKELVWVILKYDSLFVLFSSLTGKSAAIPCRNGIQGINLYKTALNIFLNFDYKLKCARILLMLIIYFVYVNSQ